MNPIWLSLIGLLLILFVARACKSTKLFWVLLFSLFGGFVGGTIATVFDKYKTDADVKKEKIVKSDLSTQKLITDVIAPTSFNTVVNGLSSFGSKINRSFTNSSIIAKNLPIFYLTTLQRLTSISIRGGPSYFDTS